jgi:golgin subfamily B member 1
MLTINTLSPPMTSDIAPFPELPVEPSEFQGLLNGNGSTLSGKNGTLTPRAEFEEDDLMEEDLGPAAPVSWFPPPTEARRQPLATTSPVSPVTVTPVTLSPVTPVSLSPVTPSPVTPVTSVTPIAAPALATSPVPPSQPAPAAGDAGAPAMRQELAALQQVLFDVTLSVTRRNEELAALEARADTARTTLETSLATHDDLTAKRDAIQAELDSGIEELSLFAEKIEAAKTRQEKLLAQERELLADFEKTQTLTAGLKSTASSLNSTIEAKTSLSESLGAELDKINAELDAAKAAKDLQEQDETARLTSLRAESDLAAAALQRVKEALWDTQIKNEALLRSGQEHSESIASLEQQRDTLTSETKALETRLEQQNAELAKATEQAAQLAESLAKQEQEAAWKAGEISTRCRKIEDSAALAAAALVQSESSLAAAEKRQETLRQESAEVTASLETMRQEHDKLAAEETALRTSVEEKTVTLATLRTELAQTRSDLASATETSTRTEAELKARLAETEASLETATAAQAKAQQSLTATQSRHEAMLRKQDEALQELETHQEKLAVLAKEEERITQALAAAPVVLPQELEAAALEAQIARKTTEHDEIQARIQQANDALAELRKNKTREEWEWTLRRQEAERDFAEESLARANTAALAAAPSGHTGTIAALRQDNAALEAGIAAKASEHAAMQEELSKATAALTELREQAARQEQEWQRRRETVEGEFAQAAEMMKKARAAQLEEQVRQQDLANDQSRTMNELQTAQASLTSLQAEAKQWRSVIDRHQSEKEALADEILRAKQKLASMNPNQGYPAPSESGPGENFDSVIADLMRLVDATDTAHAFITKNAASETTSGQFNQLRAVVTGALRNLGVRELALTAGAPVDTTLRRQIQVVKNINGDGRPRIESILSPGFEKEKPNGQTIIIRKPEVIVTSE